MHRYHCLQRGMPAAVLGVAILTGGCASGAPAHPAGTAAAATARAAAQPVADRLFVADDSILGKGRIAVLNAATGIHERTLPWGVVAPDWSVLYAPTPRHDATGFATTVEAIDVATGQPLRSASLEGDLLLPELGPDGMPAGLSPDGRWLALLSTSHGSFTQRQTLFTVVDTRFDGAPKQVVLNGDFAFDAIANDGRGLYLIEYVSTGYRVRRYDLVAGALDPGAVVEKGAQTELMQGVRVSAVASPAGDWLYSLYTDAPDGPFIHALNLADRFAICIDLPKPIAERPAAFEEAAVWSLTIAANGRTLYAINHSSGALSEIDLTQFAVHRSTTLALSRPASSDPLAWLGRLLQPAATEAKGARRGAAALSLDGRTLFLPAEGSLLSVDVATLRIGGRFLSGWSLRSIALSPDGRRLYGVSPEQGTVVQMDTATGRLDAELHLIASPGALLRVSTGP